jgi:hypothetical protein
MRSITEAKDQEVPIMTAVLPVISAEAVQKHV